MGILIVFPHTSNPDSKYLAPFPLNYVTRPKSGVCVCQSGDAMAQQNTQHTIAHPQTMIAPSRMYPAVVSQNAYKYNVG